MDGKFRYLLSMLTVAGTQHVALLTWSAKSCMLGNKGVHNHINLYNVQSESLISSPASLPFTLDL